MVLWLAPLFAKGNTTQQGRPCKCQCNTSTMRGTFKVLRRHGDDSDSASTTHNAPRKIDIDHYRALMAFVL